MSDIFNAPPPPPASGPAPSGGGSKKEKMAAGLLAIFLGSLGIHKFYLGGSKQRTAGIIMLLITILGACVLIGPIVTGIIALIEGIIYLTKDEDEFQREYAYGDKAWF